jgi:hypothetical protein
VRGSGLGSEGVRGTSGSSMACQAVGERILRPPPALLSMTTMPALFMVAALEHNELIHEAPAIVGRQALSALAHATSQ